MNRQILELRVLVIVMVLAIFVCVQGVIATGPSGASISAIQNQTSNVTNPGNVSAYAGNITELVLSSYVTTLAWQGYYGNVSGTIQLGNSAGNVFYNWSSLSPTGEVYASTNNSITWVNITCFNMTANGTYVQGYDTPGGTSKSGTNMSQLEGQYGITWNDVDGVNETFALSNHAQFTTASYTFTGGACKNAKIYNNLGAGTFDEALLYEPITKSVVYAAILQNDVTGFDSRTHDFEMLVLENGHGSDTSLTPYYFYLELS